MIYNADTELSELKLTIPELRILENNKYPCVNFYWLIQYFILTHPVHVYSKN
jgi:hypothetical protein